MLFRSKQFGALLVKLGIPQPENGTALTAEEARSVASKLGYPVLVRPSYVLGGRAMVIAYDESTLDQYMREAVDYAAPGRPILIDRFLEDAIEVDVDALCDSEHVIIGGIMEHIEEAGIHSGDSSCVLPPYHSTGTARAASSRNSSSNVSTRRSQGSKASMPVMAA